MQSIKLVCLNFLKMLLLFSLFNTLTSYLHVKTKALSPNVTNALESALTPKLKNVEVTVQNISHYCRKLSGQNSTKFNNSKSMMPRVIVLVHCSSPQ